MRVRATAQKWNRIVAAALIVLLLAAALPVRAGAADQGLVVERLNFRDVLRLYAADRSSFGANALATDENNIANASKRLAEMFTFTVGLNYTGEGFNANYFGKDITSQMGSEPYLDANILSSYDVEISPYRSYALALAEGNTTTIRVYLTGYTSAASGVEPVLHYVWQENGLWYAVKDDNPYYRVSYNGRSARQLSDTGVILTSTRAASGGTGALQSWESLTDTADGGGVVHCNGCTLVAGQGTANLFGVTADLSRLKAEGNYSSSLLAVSDFVQGDTTYQTGPLVYSRECYEVASMRRVTDGEPLKEGVSYRFRVVYDETLSVGGSAGWKDVALSVRSEVTGQTESVRDFTWYGDVDYLASDKYNPRTVEFTFTPSTEGYGVCTFIPQNLVGSESALKAADIHVRTETGSAPAPTAAPTPVATAVPVTPAPTDVPETAAPVFTAEPMAAAEPETGTPAPTATPAPTPVTPMTPPATLPILLESDPAVQLNRGVLAETLWVLNGQPTADTATRYGDLPESASTAQAILWAGRMGLMPGNGDGTFGTWTPVTREELAVVLSRYAAVRGRSVDAPADLSAWADGGQVGIGNESAVRWALERGILTAREGVYIAPGETVSCVDAVGMIAALQQSL